MICAICYEYITPETGKVELSCTHSFHYCCLTRWFGNQAMKSLSESCPCCRHEANVHEGLPEQYATDSSDSSDSYESRFTISEGDSVNPSEFDLAASREQAAALFQVKRDTLSEADLQNYAATRIQAVMRGYPVRMFWDHQKALKERIRAINRYKHSILLQATFHSISVNMTPRAWKSFCAVKIQAVWRGYSHRAWERRLSPYGNFTVRRLEPIYCQAHCITHSWILLQAVWRGYFVRKKLTKECGSPWWKAGKRVEILSLNPEQDPVIVCR